MIVITAASGQLGRLVIEELLKTTPSNEIVAAVRDPAKVGDLASRGVQIRHADYTQQATLEAAFQGASRVLLISSNAVGQRLPQHKNAIEAARKAGVGLLAYTSVLRADTSRLNLASEHLATEAALKVSGIPYVLLRNGWYTENYLAGLPTALQYGTVFGSAGEGRISSAARQDYAAAAAAVLTGTGHTGKVYELAGDDFYTLTDLAAEFARQSGKPVQYKDLPEAEYKALLCKAGLPEPFAEIYAQSDAAAAQGALYDNGHQLSRLIGRPTTDLSTLVKAALEKLT